MKDVSTLELRGVHECEVFIALLPGGRGTHVELGYALAQPHLNGNILLHHETGDIFKSDEDACAFYHHPHVKLLKSRTMRAMKDVIHIYAAGKIAP